MFPTLGLSRGIPFLLPLLLPWTWGALHSPESHTFLLCSWIQE